jgi:uncharacterized lipoprotein YmbA
MTIHSTLRNLLLSILCMVLAACATTPQTNFYVLTPMAAPANTTEKTGTKRLIGLGPVTLPALLERKQLVTRTGNNTLQIAELHQWAAPLKDNITQTLTENLAKLLPNDLVKAYPWSAYGQADYHILIDVIRFDATPGQSADFEAEWVVVSEKKPEILTSGRHKTRSSLADASYSGAVQALSNTLAEFSRRLAVVLDGVK